MKKSLRKANWDYSSTADYFITTRIMRNSPLLCKISNDEIILNQFGQIVREKWESIPAIYPNVKLGTFVIMPDHFHGILIFKEAADLNRTKINTFGPQRKNLPAVMRGFKGAVTFEIKKIEPTFKWQPGYYDRIIRSSNDFVAIEEYIRNNPIQAGKYRTK